MNLIVDDSVGPDAIRSASMREPGRLAGKVALVTGAAGNLGSAIVRRYLIEGATVVLTGRNRARVDAARELALAETGAPKGRASTVVMNAGDPTQVRAAVAELLSRHGRIDILVNNAGSAGPRQTIENLPFSQRELDALRASGASDTETVADALHNILAVAWNVVRVAGPALQPGAAIINVSTIFSRTEYFGRAAYVVPKAALNALSRELAAELGAGGIRVNNLIPGPISSERIRSVFASMDKLRGVEPGTMAHQSLGRMSLARGVEDGQVKKTFPTPRDVADACVFLGSDESAAFNGTDFEVTHGMKVAAESRSTWMARPTMRSVDAGGQHVLVAAGDQVEEALVIARAQADCGAAVVLGFASEADTMLARTRLHASPAVGTLDVIRLDRGDAAGMEAALQACGNDANPFSGAIVLPAYGVKQFQGALAIASDADVSGFIQDELGGALAIARALTRYWRERPDLVRDPRVVFVTNGSDECGNVYATLLRAANEELIRVWRDETDVEQRLGRRGSVVWANQIVRYENEEAENMPFTAGQAARLLFKEQRIAEINLYLPQSIADASGARRAMVGLTENLAGLHLGKAVLITGGSAGIGGQIARLLALAGAKVMLVARRRQELEQMRARIIEELKDAGLPNAERRVHTLSDVDVGDPATLREAVQATLAAFGRIDYLINNAGVSGAEEMVVDMPVAAWRYTLNANLISNYALLREVTPLMKKQGSGYILNVSSYFGGEKYLAVAYPNRADYAVSKAGQRAMVETMARFLGPEIQINAIAPGPVDGDRLLGIGGRPGLFERRGHLIMEKKRLNAVYAGVVQTLRRGLRIEATLARLASNDAASLAHDTDAPHELREFAAKCVSEGRDDCACGAYLLTPAIAERLVDRLRLAGYFIDLPEWENGSSKGWLKREPPGTPFFPPADIKREAEKVRSGILSLLHLRKMPTETEVALATVFFLADRAVSGETFMPSGGLNVERSVTERELFGSASRERLDQMRGRTVWLIGEHLTAHLAEAARQWVTQCKVGAVVALTRTAEGGTALADLLVDLPEAVLHVLPCGDDIEAAMDRALTVAGRPSAVISTPFAPLPDTLIGAAAEDSLDPAAFNDLVDTNLTHHFRVARKASLFDKMQLVLVSPDVEAGQGAAAFALANFIKTTLHAFTLTLAVENERLVHEVAVNQINLTRRVRSEEPRDEDERLEEVKRFGRAVLLAGAPIRDSGDSRYRARIYRGMAITV